MKPKVYLETSVVSYLTARPSKKPVVLAHQAITKRWWSGRRSRFTLFCSQLVLDEAAKGDAIAARKRMRILANIRSLAATDDAKAVAQKILRERLVPPKAAIDAAHIGIAATHGMDYLLTWNCKHIANAEIRDRLRLLCDGLGFVSPKICTPEELMGW